MDLRKYQDFVQKVTSRESDSLPDLVERLRSLDPEQASTPLLLTAAIGLSSETGEFNEIVKKIVFQGKPLTEDNVHHMKRELGDILWYWVSACRALRLNPDEVLAENVAKLSGRYPGLVFSAERSENRAADDL
ncbi:pyrophosphatase [bacterium]|nr:pyrophosphatase [bacterium]